MVVVRPADAQAILSRLLDAGGSVAVLPVLPLGGEEEIACDAHSEIIRGGIDHRFGGVKAIRLLDELPRARAKTFHVREPSFRIDRLRPLAGLSGAEAAIAVALD